MEMMEPKVDPPFSFVTGLDDWDVAAEVEVKLLILLLLLLLLSSLFSTLPNVVDSRVFAPRSNTATALDAL